jgi:hypothetical protein
MNMLNVLEYLSQFLSLRQLPDHKDEQNTPSVEDTTQAVDFIQLHLQRQNSEDRDVTSYSLLFK